MKTQAVAADLELDHKQAEQISDDQKKHNDWQEDEYQQIHQAFDQIREKHRQDLGQKDVKYITSLRKFSRIFELIGRFLILILPGPFALLGAPFLFLHRNLESIEIGHNVLHGQYDSLPEVPQFHVKNFRWKAPVDEKAWRHEHNARHHVHTNVYEKDPDLNHGFLRVNNQIPHNFLHYFQVPIYLVLFYPIMLYNFDSQNLGLVDKFRQRFFPKGNQGYATYDGEEMTDQQRSKRHRRAVWRIWTKEYLFFPLLALLMGYGALKVFLVNLLVDIVNSYWIALTIQATHFTEPLQPEDALKNKGKWYISQLDSSVNFKGTRLQSILWGHLNYQVEHHLFPDIPAHRYPDMAKEVQQVCSQYNLPYKCNDSWGQAIKKFIGAMWKYSFKDAQPLATAYLDEKSAIISQQGVINHVK